MFGAVRFRGSGEQASNGFGGLVSGVLGFLV